MRHSNEERFEDFFMEDRYIAVKNHLYNYRLRRMAINGRLAEQPPGLILEVGSGLSPIVTDRDDIIYSELSYRALQTLKRLNKDRGYYVVADGTKLPFRDAGVDYVVCSEVLEHVEHDHVAIAEMGRVLKEDGTAYVTVPHRQFYFASDDAFVAHFRRYEIDEMREKMESGGLELHRIQKVLGPLEKITMWSVVRLFSVVIALTGSKEATDAPSSSWFFKLEPFIKWGNICYTGAAWLDARIWPRALSTVLLFEATPTQTPKP
ncbi:MAG: class I SAM-dependent methyltransferase [Candidatus Hydrogenedentota bacterium]